MLEYIAIVYRSLSPDIVVRGAPIVPQVPILPDCVRYEKHLVRLPLKLPLLQFMVRNNGELCEVILEAILILG